MPRVGSNPTHATKLVGLIKTTQTRYRRFKRQPQIRCHGSTDTPFVNTQQFTYNIKTQNLPPQCFAGSNPAQGVCPSMQEVKAGLFKMLTATNPECSRCCRFVGTQFKSGRDYGEYGKWRHRLTVRTLVFETSNAGSNPADAQEFLMPSQLRGRACDL